MAIKDLFNKTQSWVEKVGGKVFKSLPISVERKGILTAALTLALGHAAMAQENNAVEQVAAAFENAQKRCVEISQVDAEKAVDKIEKEYAKVHLENFENCLEQMIIKNIPDAQFHFNGNVQQDMTDGEINWANLKTKDAHTTGGDKKFRLIRGETQFQGDEILGQYVTGLSGSYGTDGASAPKNDTIAVDTTAKIAAPAPEMQEEKVEFDQGILDIIEQYTNGIDSTARVTAAGPDTALINFMEKVRAEEAAKLEMALADTLEVPEITPEIEPETAEITAEIEPEIIAPAPIVAEIPTADTVKIAETPAPDTTKLETFVAQLGDTAVIDTVIADTAKTVAIAADTAVVAPADTAKHAPKLAHVAPKMVAPRHVKPTAKIETAKIENVFDSTRVCADSNHVSPLSIDDIWFNATRIESLTKPNTSPEPKKSYCVAKETICFDERTAAKFGVTMGLLGSVFAAMGISFLVNNRANRREFERKLAAAKKREAARTNQKSQEK
jgi:hypothetical protein